MAHRRRTIDRVREWVGLGVLIAGLLLTVGIFVLGGVLLVAWLR